MSEQELLGLLEDPKVLLEAYAASSAHVLRQALRNTKPLQQFRGRGDLAPLILERVRNITPKPADPVVLAAHLHALELTGARSQVGEALRLVLTQPALLADSLVGQLAGHIGAELAGIERRPKPGDHVPAGELERIRRALEREEGPR